MFGYCQDKYCENQNEKTNLRLFNGVMVCDGCYDELCDGEEFMDANRQDMIDAGCY